MSGPNVYQYSNDRHQSGIYNENPINHSTNPNNRTYYGESQINKSYVPQNNPNTGFTASQVRKTSNLPPVVVADPHANRYDLYGGNPAREYKYNMFSALDEPWNNCCNKKKCGSFPGNECIAKDHTHTNW